MRCGEGCRLCLNGMCRGCSVFSIHHRCYYNQNKNYIECTKFPLSILFAVFVRFRL